MTQLAQPQTRQRRFFRHLQHDGAAGGQRRPQLPGRHQQREIPRNDLADHADRLGPRVRQIFGARRTGPEIGMVLPSILVAQPAM